MKHMYCHWLAVRAIDSLNDTKLAYSHVHLDLMMQQMMNDSFEHRHTAGLDDGSLNWSPCKEG